MAPFSAAKTLRWNAVARSRPPFIYPLGLLLRLWLAV
jgi:hypothetical protein